MREGERTSRAPPRQPASVRCAASSAARASGLSEFALTPPRALGAGERGRVRVRRLGTTRGGVNDRARGVEPSPDDESVPKEAGLPFRGDVPGDRDRSIRCTCAAIARSNRSGLGLDGFRGALERMEWSPYAARRGST